MNFRFAHYDPPKEDKKRSRRPNNPTKTANTRSSDRTTKPQGSRTTATESAKNPTTVQRLETPCIAEPEAHLETTVYASDVLALPLRKVNDLDIHTFDFSVRDWSSPSTTASGSSSSSSDHELPLSTSRASAIVTTSGYYGPPRLPSLVTVLGEGRLDPFHIYPVEYVTPYVQMLIDHAFTHKWPNVSPVPSQTPSTALTVTGNEIHPVKRAWLQCVLNHPVSFYALLYASSKHLAFLHNGNEEHFSQASLLRLSYKTEAVKLINESLRHLNGEAIPDHLLIAILSLGAHGSEEKRPPPPVPPPVRRLPQRITHLIPPQPLLTSPTPLPLPPDTPSRESPLARAQMLHFYGFMDQEAAHMSALRTLVAHNTSTHKSISLPGLAGAIELGDILNSTITHRRPCVAVPKPISSVHSVAAFLERSIAVLPVSKLLAPSGDGVSGQARELLEAMLLCRAVVAALDAFVAARETLAAAAATASTTKDANSSTTTTTTTDSRLRAGTAITLTDLTITRNAAHYAILALPPANPLWGPRFAVYESVRVAMLIFSDLVLFPLPRKTGVRGRYVGGLREGLRACAAQRVWTMTGGEARVLGWCAMVGAVAAGGGEEEVVGEQREGQGDGEGGFEYGYAWEEDVEGEESDVAFFVGKMRTSFSLLGVGTWEGVEAWLGRWLWWDWLLGERGRRLWEVGGATERRS